MCTINNIIDGGCLFNDWCIIDGWYLYILFLNAKKLNSAFPDWAFINCQDEWKWC